MMHGGRVRMVLVGLVLACAGWAAFAPTAGATSAFDMRGEWLYQVSCSCGQEATGTMLITKTELATGSFSGTTVFDNLVSGNVSGTVSGSELALKVVLPDTPEGEKTYTLEHGFLETVHGEFAGMGYFNAHEFTGEMKAERTRTIEQIEKEAEEEALRAKEKAEQEKIEQEKQAKEKAEKEATEKIEAEKREKEAKEKQAAKEQQEAKEKQAAKEKAEKEAKEKAEKEAAAKQSSQSSSKQSSGQSSQGHKAGPAPKPVVSDAKTLLVDASGIVSLTLSNPNHYTVSGSVSLTAKTGPASKSSTGALAASSFTIARHAKRTVKLKLSGSAAAALAHGGTMHVVVKITTRAAGHAAVTRTSEVTLRSSAHP